MRTKLLGRRIVCLTAAIVATLPAGAFASHFRGAAMVPTVSATGLLTISSTSFWRKGSTENIAPVVGGVGVAGLQSSILDSSDSRFDRVVQVNTIQLPGAGTYSIVAGSCCRIAVGTPGNGLNNWTESSWEMNSTIVWNGSTAANPIAFNFGSVQPEVSRLGAHSDNLDAASPDGRTLSYNQNLNIFINSQIPGFNINTTTGQMTITAAGTAAMTDNNNPNSVGGDGAFSGNILSSDGSSVEFDWFFDGVDTAANNAPDVTDGALAGLPGTLFNFVFGISDPEGETLGSGLSFDAGFFSILGSVPAIAATFNNLTGAFSWDSAGSALGVYVFQVRGRDSGNLTDVGSLTITLGTPGPPVGAVPEPMSLLVHGGLFATSCFLWRRRQRAGS